jgi:hypothetical protein
LVVFETPKDYIILLKNASKLLQIKEIAGAGGVDFWPANCTPRPSLPLLLLLPFSSSRTWPPQRCSRREHDHPSKAIITVVNGD